MNSDIPVLENGYCALFSFGSILLCRVITFYLDDKLFCISLLSA